METTTQVTTPKANPLEVRIDQVLAGVKDGDRITMYQVAGFFSTLKGERVREQMLYNYRKNNLIKVDGDGRIGKAALKAWFLKKLTK